jgi:hypothetical protein
VPRQIDDVRLDDGLERYAPESRSLKPEPKRIGHHDVANPWERNWRHVGTGTRELEQTTVTTDMCSHAMHQDIAVVAPGWFGAV